MTPAEAFQLNGAGSPFQFAHFAHWSNKPFPAGSQHFPEPNRLGDTATAAPGNLLGNLLCAVVHLLDSNGPLTTLTSLLNQILGAIRI